MTTYLGKSCSFCLPRVPFVNCRQFMYLVISLLVLRAGYGIWLYQFLIIAYLFTLSLPIFHVRNASALMQENLRRVTTNQKSQFAFYNLRKNASSEQYQYMYIHKWTTAYAVFWVVYLCIGDYTFVNIIGIDIRFTNVQ